MFKEIILINDRRTSDRSLDCPEVALVPKDVGHANKAAPAMVEGSTWTSNGVFVDRHGSSDSKCGVDLTRTIT